MGTLWEQDGNLICNSGCTTLVECDECPCEEAAEDCQYCDDCTPLEFAFTFSDVTVCTDCCAYGLDYSWKYFIGSVDGTYYLEQMDGSPCCWIWQGTTGNWYARRYSYDDWCAGTYVEMDLTPTIVFVKTDGGWAMRFLGVPTAADEATYTNIPVPIVFIAGETSGYDNCDVTISDIDNDPSYECAIRWTYNINICSETGQTYAYTMAEDGTLDIVSQGC